MTRILIAGGTGLIGRALAESLIRDGVAVDVLTRRKAAPRRATRSDTPTSKLRCTRLLGARP